MDATAVTAWATAGLAAVGTISLISTALVIRQNKKLIETTEREAKAVEDQAKAAFELVVESRRDRELAHRPNLVFNPEPAGRPTLRNNGRGVATRCRYVVAEPNDVSTIQHSSLFDVGPGEAQIVPPLTQEEDSCIEVIEDLPAGGKRLEAVVCEDFLGDKFRFFRERPAQVWRRDDSREPPRWTAWY